EKEADDPGLAIAIKHVSFPPPIELVRKHPVASRFADLLESMLSKEPEKRPTIPTILEILKKERMKMTTSSTKTSVSGKEIFSTGRIVSEIYRVESFIGKGSMSEVYKALDTSLNRTVALKILNEEAATEEIIVDRFLKEGQLLATVEHPNVLHIYASSRDPETEKPFLIMEYIDGTNLSNLLSTIAKDPRKVVPLMLQLLEGIGACHSRGIIHRDLKPSNLIITRDGTLKIFDFGLAKAGARLTRTEMTVGTPKYMSPEQCRGAKDLTPQSDVYSAGIIFWELIYGEVPFEADDSSNPELSIAMKHVNETLPMKALSKDDPFLPLLPIVKRMLNKEPSDRPTVEDLIKAFDNFVEEHFPSIEKEPVATSRRKSRRLKISGMYESSVKEFPSIWDNLPLGVFSLLAICGILAGAWLYFKPGSYDQKKLYVDAIQASMKKGNFDDAARNLELLEKEPESQLIAQPLKSIIGAEFERKGISALNFGNTSE
ncbi:protein kinase, partial [bacterium]|nr:protein kinase [bacterium]